MAGINISILYKPPFCRIPLPARMEVKGQAWIPMQKMSLSCALHHPILCTACALISLSLFWVPDVGWDAGRQDRLSLSASLPPTWAQVPVRLCWPSWGHGGDKEGSWTEVSHFSRGPRFSPDTYLEAALQGWESQVPQPSLLYLVSQMYELALTGHWG